MVNSAKQDFIKESLEQNKSDPKKFWRIINNSILKKNPTQELTNLITDDGLNLSYKDSCSYMNNYLSSVGETLNNQFDDDIDPTNIFFNTYSRIPNDHKYIITDADVLKVIGDIESCKGSGIEFLPTFILKDTFTGILPQIVYMMNQSVSTGIFPDKWAMASVTPIPKAGKLTSVKNWRPISILPLPGKLLEKICTKFLLDELDENAILTKEQFGFRAGLSTSHAIHGYVKYIIDGLNSKSITASIYLDVARAFDSVNYEILILKLRDMGISDMLINWVKGYLSNRQMCTKFNGYTSDLKPLVCGVPQGSVIGPILFLCYVNDIVSVAHTSGVKITLYADDTVIYFNSKNVLEIQLRLQCALDKVSSWCKYNCIKLNISKTKPCYYGNRHLLNTCNLDLKLDQTILNSCTQYKYLGVLLDETMNMEPNFNYIFKRLSYKIFQFSKIRHRLDTKTRVLVYKQTVLPFAEYAGFLLFLNRKLDYEKLQKLQNRALRFCYDILNPRDIKIVELHQQSNLSMLLERRELQLLGLMYDIRNVDEFIDIPIVYTRQADKIVFKTDIVHYDIYKRSPYYIGSQLWSNLPKEIQHSQTRLEFKNGVKRFYRNRNQNPNV